MTPSAPLSRSLSTRLSVVTKEGFMMAYEHQQTREKTPIIRNHAKLRLNMFIKHSDGRGPWSSSYVHLMSRLQTAQDLCIYVLYYMVWGWWESRNLGMVEWVARYYLILYKQSLQWWIAVCDCRHALWSHLLTFTFLCIFIPTIMIIKKVYNVICWFSNQKQQTVKGGCTRYSKYTPYIQNKLYTQCKTLERVCLSVLRLCLSAALEQTATRRRRICAR